MSAIKITPSVFTEGIISLNSILSKTRRCTLHKLIKQLFFSSAVPDQLSMSAFRNANLQIPFRIALIHLHPVSRYKCNK